MDVNNVIRVPTSLNTTFFRYWFEFLKPIHNLTSREMDVIVFFIHKRYELSKVITDEDLLDKVLMSDDVKSELREVLGISKQHMHVLMSTLKKHGFIVDGKINKRYIPNIKEGSSKFFLLIFFDLEDEKKE